MNVQDKTVGCVVDAVTRVMRIDRDRIRPSPLGPADGPCRYVSGLARLDERLLIMLDVERLLRFDDLPAASWPIIRLSTIAFDLAGMARAAAGLVVERIEHPGRDVQRLTFSTSFVDRDTLGPVSA